MSKNLTRKGLALGAIVALGSTLFAGAPAFAGSESAKITLVPSAGTTYTTLIGASFDLKTELDPTLKTIESKTLNELTYVITNSSAQKLTIDLDGARGTDFADVDYRTGDVADTLGTEVANADNVPATTAGAGNAKVISVTHYLTEQSADAADIGANTLRITSSTDSTDPFSVTIQAFIDDNNNGVVDTFELTSPTRTLNFIKASTATVTTSVTSAVIGAGTIQGTVVIGNDVNNKSLVGQVSIGFFKNASAVKILNSSSASVDTIDVEWDADNSVLKNVTYKSLAATSTDGSGDAITADVYTAKAYFGVARTLIGVESAAVAPTAGTVTSADHTDYLIATNSANATQNANDVATAVRSGYTGAVTFKSFVLNANNSSGTPKTASDATVVAVAGVKVKVTLTKGSTFSAGHEVSAGGKTLTSTSGAVSYETTTDATGAVTVAATSNKGTVGESYEVKVQVLTSDIGYETGDVNTVTFTAATNSAVVTTAAAGNGARLQVAKGGSLTLAYQVRDSFGALSTVAGTYRLAITDANNVGGGVVDGFAAVSGGAGSFTFTDNTVTATGSYDVVATLEKLNAAGTAYETTGLSKTVVVVVGASAVTGISVPANTAVGSEIALSTKTFISHDFRLDSNSKTFATNGLSGGFTVNGTATSASGAIVAGALVTISAPGIQFVARNSGDDTDALVTLDTVSVRTDASGNYSVVAHSHKAGDVPITVTSGSSTKTVTAKFAYATTADEDTVITITGASSIKAGRSASYIIALADKWGNAIKGAISIDVAQDGAGYLTSTPTAVAATSGKARLNLITQPADAGLTTFTVTYDVAGTTADVVVTKDVLVNVSASVSKAATSRATVKNASGLTVKVVRGTKSVTKTATSDNYKVSLKGGSGSVKVYVNNILVATKK